jgi:beta-glucosidase-like glycosyl hydrolase
MVEYNKIGMEVVQSAEHREQAVKAAFMSFVLLKNDNNLLPIKTQFNHVAVRFLLIFLTLHAVQHISS